MKSSEYTTIIAGSGIAGLYTALRLSESNQGRQKILLVTKSNLSESNSRYAQGGIVGVMHENASDSVSLHVKDTLKAGAGLSDTAVVQFISENSEKVINDLLSHGVDFDRDEDDNLRFTMEGAHSARRILHAGGDATGLCIEKQGIKLFKNVLHRQGHITVTASKIEIILPVWNQITLDSATDTLIQKFVLVSPDNYTFH